MRFFIYASLSIVTLLLSSCANKSINNESAIAVEISLDGSVYSPGSAIYLDNEGDIIFRIGVTDQDSGDALQKVYNFREIEPRLWKSLIQKYSLTEAVTTERLREYAVMGEQYHGLRVFYEGDKVESGSYLIDDPSADIWHFIDGRVWGLCRHEVPKISKMKGRYFGGLETQDK